MPDKLHYLAGRRIIDLPSPRKTPSSAWGNAVYVNLNNGDILPYLGKSVTLLNCFPQRVELRHGSLDIETPIRTPGYFRFANQEWENGNTQRLSDWNDVLGYGWQLGDRCRSGEGGTFAGRRRQ